MRRLALAFALAACSGSDIPIDDLEGEVIETYCNLYVTCGLIDDVATCRAVYPDVELDPSLLAAVKAGKVIYHSDKARDCLNGVGDSCNRDSFLDVNDREACDETFEGTVGAGGQCAMDEECVSGNCNVAACPDACCQGTCVGDAPPVRPRVGDACNMVGQASCLDSYCDTTAQVCTAYKGIGGTCTTSTQCGVGTCANGVCTAFPGPGEACGSTTATSACRDLGYTCSQTSMTCVAYGLSGDACAADRDCSPLYRCDAGACDLLPIQGEMCGTGIDCLGSSYCEPTTSTCTAPKADNAACVGDEECASRNCDTNLGVCVTSPICI